MWQIMEAVAGWSCADHRIDLETPARIHSLSLIFHHCTSDFIDVKFVQRCEKEQSYTRRHPIQTSPENRVGGTVHEVSGESKL